MDRDKIKNPAFYIAGWVSLVVTAGSLDATANCAQYLHEIAVLAYGEAFGAAAEGKCSREAERRC